MHSGIVLGCNVCMRLGSACAGAAGCARAATRACMGDGSRWRGDVGEDLKELASRGRKIPRPLLAMVQCNKVHSGGEQGRSCGGVMVRGTSLLYQDPSQVDGWVGLISRHEHSAMKKRSTHRTHEENTSAMARAAAHQGTKSKVHQERHQAPGTKKATRTTGIGLP